MGYWASRSPRLGTEGGRDQVAQIAAPPRSHENAPAREATVMPQPRPWSQFLEVENSARNAPSPSDSRVHAPLELERLDQTGGGGISGMFAEESCLRPPMISIGCSHQQTSSWPVFEPVRSTSSKMRTGPESRRGFGATLHPQGSRPILGPFWVDELKESICRAPLQQQLRIDDTETETEAREPQLDATST